MPPKNPEVLIVDDEQAVCDLLREELTDQGYLCTVADNAKDAIGKLATQHFDLALLDILLPGGSGVELLREIRCGCPDTAAIMVTAVNAAETALECMKLGAADYLVKPFALDKLLACVQRAIETRNQSEQDAEEFPEINAVALGVELRYDLLFDFSARVTEETAVVSQRLGIAEEHINRWVRMRRTLGAERKRLMESSLNKLKRSPLAQMALGMTEPVRHESKPNGAQN